MPRITSKQRLRKWITIVLQLAIVIFLDYLLHNHLLRSLIGRKYEVEKVQLYRSWNQNTTGKLIVNILLNTLQQTAFMTAGVWDLKLNYWVFSLRRRVWTSTSSARLNFLLSKGSEKISSVFYVGDRTFSESNSCQNLSLVPALATWKLLMQY